MHWVHLWYTFCSTKNGIGLTLQVKTPYIYIHIRKEEKF